MKVKRLAYTIGTWAMLCSSVSLLYAQFNPTFSQWVEQTSQFPHWEDLYRNFDDIEQLYQEELPEGHYQALQKIKQLHRKTNFLDAFKEELQKFQDNAHQHLNDGKWIGANPFSNQFVASASDQSFRPFAEKRVISPADTAITFGDLHGSLHALMDVLEHLRNHNHLRDDFTLAPNTYMLFLGDFVDRGPYGIETLYTILRLKNANPDRVILVRGNHEDAYMNTLEGDWHAFSIELEAKFFNLGTIQGDTDAENLLNVIKTNLYEHLPVILLLGNTNVVNAFLYCVHGGIEIGFNPFPLTAMEEYSFEYISQLDRFDNYLQMLLDKMPDLPQAPEGPRFAEIGASHHNSTPQRPRDLGFLWNDFVVDDEHANRYGHVQFTRGSNQLHAHSHTIARILMEKLKIYAIIRAHQHADDKRLGPLFSRIEQHNGMYIIGSQTPVVRAIAPLNKHSITTLGVLPGSNQSDLSEGFYAILKPTQDLDTPWDISLMHKSSPSSTMLVDDDDAFDEEEIEDDTTPMDVDVFDEEEIED